MLALNAGDRDAATLPDGEHERAGRERASTGRARGSGSGVRGKRDGAAQAPALRIHPAPRCEPLTDEERGSGVAGSFPTHALPPDLATGVRVRRGLREGAGDGAAVAPLRAGGGAPARRAAAGTALVSGAVGPVPPPPVEIVGVVAPGLGQPGTPTPRPAAGGMDLRLSAKRLLAACVEVMGGFRPVAQLRPFCVPERFDSIANRLIRPVSAGRGHGATRTSPIATRLAPPRPGRPARTSAEDRITVRRVQICDVMEGIAELVVVMSRHTKVWAMTVRMERNRGRWVCAHLDVL